MDRYIAALVLNDIGTLLELNGADPFKAKAYYAAARALEGAGEELPELIRGGRLRSVPGIGPASARVVEELARTGGSRLHAELRERTPEGMVRMLTVPGLGARRIHLLHEALGIETLGDLERAAEAGQIAAVAGFGARTEARIRAGVAFVRRGAGRRRQPEAFQAAERLLGFLEGLPEVEEARLAGELRRRLETVGSVEAVVRTTAPEAVTDAFLALPGLVGGTREEEGVASGSYADGMPLRVRCVAAEAFVAAWVLATGPEAHLQALAARAQERGMRLRADGLWRGGRRLRLADEPALYQRLELAFVPPELRDDVGWLRAAAEGPLPPLVEYAELRGCFHCHTTASDGKATLEEMAGAAIERGWEYLGIADHSAAASYAGGLTPAQVRRQQRAIDAWNRKHGKELWLFKGIEADILPDGRVDYEEEGDLLASFDYVVASLHSGFRKEEGQTARVLRALANPHVTFLGHLTGRQLLSREGVPLDVRAVLAEAARRGVDLEINADPRRLELDWRWWPLAASLGVKAAINPDAHSTAGLGAVVYGIGVARKAALGAEDVVNAWPVREVKAYFKRRAKAKARARDEAGAGAGAEAGERRTARGRGKGKV